MELDKDHVLFDGKYKKWTAIVKQGIDEGTEAMEVARILGRVRLSTHRKTWDFLSDDFDLEKMDNIAAELVGATRNKKGNWEVKGRQSGDKVEEAIRKLKSPKLLSTLELKTAPSKDIAKAYINRKVLDLLKFPIELMYLNDDGKPVDLVEKYLKDKHDRKMGLKN